MLLPDLKIVMHKFFVEKKQIFDGYITIRNEDAGHIGKSLRMKIGQRIQVSNGNCQEYIGVIESIDKSEVQVKILETFRSNNETLLNITLYQGVCKGSKMDLIIQKCVELGVKRFIPVITERTVVDINDKKDKKVHRWQKIALEAAKQSKRGVVPIIEQILSIEDLQNEFKNNELNIIAYENEKESSLKKILEANPHILNIGIFIGPEGGISMEEINFLQSYGGRCFTLGNRILRTETAGFTTVSMLIYQYEL